MKGLWITFGGLLGWAVVAFAPTFPLIVVAVAFILHDAFTAYQLDRRVKVAFTDRTARHEAKKAKRGKVKKLKCNDDDGNEVTDAKNLSWGLPEELGQFRG